MNLFDLVARLSLDSSDYEAGLQFAQQGLGTFKKVTLATFAASSAAFISFAKDAVATGMGFDAAMSQVAATMGVSVDEIENLREFAKNMGATTKFTATEAAQALNYMALAGYDAEKSMSMLPTVLNLASAGGFDLARASDMVTDAQSALGLTTEQTTVMVDQMARAASKSNTSVEQLGDAMLTIGSTAKFMAGGTDRLQTVLGLLADNGIKGSEAGTHLRNMLLKLSAPTKDGSDAMLSLGFSVFDAEGKMKDMQEIITDLNKSFEGLTDQQKIEYISKIFNARDVAAVNALLGTSKERWDELGGAIAEASGSAQEMATTQLGNLTGDVTIMKSAVEGLKIQFAEGVTPAIRDVVQRLTAALSRPKTQKFLREVGEGLGKVIKFVSDLVANYALPKLTSLFENGGEKIKRYGAVLLGMVSAMKTAATVTSLLAGTLSPTGLLLKGVELLVGGLVAAGAAADVYYSSLYYLNNEQKELVEKANEIHDSRRVTQEAYEESAKAALQERDATTDLWKELQLLVDADGRVLEGNQNRVDFILGQLNDALGTEYERNGDIIDQYQTMQQEIDGLIQKRAAEALLSAGQDQYTQALQQRQEALTTAGELYDHIRVAQEDLNKAVQAEAEFWAANQESFDEADEHERNKILGRAEEVEKAKIRVQKAFDEVSAKYQQANDDAAGYYETVEKYENAQAALLEGNSQKAIDLMAGEYSTSLDYYMKKKELNEKERADFEAKLKKQESYVAQYKRNYQAGMAGFTKPVLDELQKQVEEARRIGNNIGKATGDGVGSFSDYAAKKARALVRSMFGAMRNEAQIASPSKVARGIGRNVGGSVGLGLDDVYDETVASAVNLMDGVLGNLDVLPETETVISRQADSEGGMGAVLSVLRDIRDNMDFDVVLDDGTLVGRIDKLLGQTAMRKARGNA